MRKPNLFLDCDGVLANFNKRAEQILGMEPRKYEDLYGEKEFWKKINSTETFFFDLEPMPDAYELFDAVKHLNPVILTGKPKGEIHTENKLRWRDKYFPETEMIVCAARDKIKFAKPGDVIVDDWEKHRQRWIDGGGVWVLHKSAKQSIEELKKLGII